MKPSEPTGVLLDKVAQLYQSEKSVGSYLKWLKDNRYVDVAALWVESNENRDQRARLEAIIAILTNSAISSNPNYFVGSTMDVANSLLCRYKYKHNQLKYTHCLNVAELMGRRDVIEAVHKLEEDSAIDDPTILTICKSCAASA